MRTLIHTEKLSKHYGKGGEIRALDELDLEVREGETFGCHPARKLERIE